MLKFWPCYARRMACSEEDMCTVSGEAVDAYMRACDRASYYWMTGSILSSDDVRPFLIL